MRKRILLGLFALTMALVVVSFTFANGQKEKGSSSTASNASVTLKVWNRWPEMVPSFKSTVASFEKQYPNIKIDFSTAPTAQNVAQLQAAITGGDVPDVFYYSPSYTLQQLVQLNVVHKLNDVITPDIAKQYIPGTWAQGYTTLNGDIYQFPLFAGYHYTYMMYYNTELMKKYGITSVPKTWAEFIAAGKKIYQESNGTVYGFCTSASSSWDPNGYIMHMASAISPNVFWDSGGVTGINYKTGMYEFNSPGIVETMNFLKQLQTDNILQPNSLQSNNMQSKALFETGKAVFTFDGTFVAGELASDGFKTWGVANVPTKNGMPAYEGFQGESPAGFLVSQHTPHYAQVKIFLDYLIKNFYRTLAEHGAGEPPILSTMNGIKEPFPQFPAVMKIQNAIKIEAPNPYQKNINTIGVLSAAAANAPQRNLGDIMDGYWTGQMSSPNAALDQLTKEYNTALTNAIAKSGGKVTRQDFIFPNWTPFKPYTAADYQSQ